MKLTWGIFFQLWDVISATILRWMPNRLTLRMRSFAIGSYLRMRDRALGIMLKKIKAFLLSLTKCFCLHILKL